jgi:hypothetical protein
LERFLYGICCEKVRRGLFYGVFAKRINFGEKLTLYFFKWFTFATVNKAETPLQISVHFYFNKELKTTTVFISSVIGGLAYISNLNSFLSPGRFRP